MKIMLVAMNAKYVHSNLAVYNLKAYAESENVSLHEYTINHNLSDILMDIYRQKPDVVAFSCYIWNIEEVKTIAYELKQLNNSLKIWLGGPEVSYDAKEMLCKNTYVDLVINGEGEATFKELVSLIEDDNYQDDALDQVVGITYRSMDGAIKDNGYRELMSMDEIPFIYQDFTDFENKIIYYESSRGCPFSCSYCLSSIDKSVRFRDIETVKKELQIFLDAGVKQVKFIDRTFNCKHSHAKAIWQYLLDHDNGITNFHFEISADLLDEEEIEMISKMRPGLIQLEIGLQTSHSETIEAIRRKMDLNKLIANMRAVRKPRNIHQHLDLIVGLPEESYEDFKASFDFAFAIRPDQLQLGFLKVLKGSFMHENQKAYELVYHKRPPYEVMQTKWISFDEIIMLKKVEEVLEVYYNSNQFVYSLEYLLSFYESGFDFFQTLADYYDTHGLFDIAHKRVKRYEILYQFAKEDQRIRLEVLAELMLHDLYLRENLKARPSFSTSEQELFHDHQAFFLDGGDERIRAHYPNHKKLMVKAMHLEGYHLDMNHINQLVQEIALADDKKELAEELRKLSLNENLKNYYLYDYNVRNPLNNEAKVVTL